MGATSIMERECSPLIVMPTISIGGRFVGEFGARLSVVPKLYLLYAPLPC